MLKRFKRRASGIAVVMLSIITAILFSAPYAYGCEDTSAATLIRLTNEERVAMGLAELAEDTQLDAIAQARADEMASSGQFSHTRPNGEKFSSLFKVDGKWITSYGQENLARGYSSSTSAFEGWKASESHYANITNTRVTRIGAGGAYGADGKVYYVTEYAQ